MFIGLLKFHGKDCLKQEISHEVYNKEFTYSLEAAITIPLVHLSSRLSFFISVLWPLYFLVV